MTDHIEHDDNLAGTPDLDVIDDSGHLADEPFSVDDVLAMAELPERTASICLAANLQGEWDRLLDELKTLITDTGEILDTAEASAGEVSAESRAIEIQDRLNVLRREMRKKMWHVTFRAMPSDDYASFVKRHRPKDGPKVDYTDFYNRLIAETAVNPTLSMEQIQALRKKFGPQAIGELIQKATQACTAGGLDVPKLPGSLRNLEAE